MTFCGRDLGGIPRIISRHGKYYVLHVAGHKAWAGRFMERDYISPHYYIVVVGIVEGDPYGLCVKKYKSGRDWRRIRAEATEEAKILCRQSKLGQGRIVQ